MYVRVWVRGRERITQTERGKESSGLFFATRTLNVTFMMYIIYTPLLYLPTQLIIKLYVIIYDLQIIGWIHIYETPGVSSCDEESHLVCHSQQVLLQVDSWFLLSPDHDCPHTNTVQWNRGTKIHSNKKNIISKKKKNRNYKNKKNTKKNLCM